jgi:hypothetical protein
MDTSSWARERGTAPAPAIGSSPSPGVPFEVPLSKCLFRSVRHLVMDASSRAGPRPSEAGLYEGACTKGSLRTSSGRLRWGARWRAGAFACARFTLTPKDQQRRNRCRLSRFAGYACCVREKRLRPRRAHTADDSSGTVVQVVHTRRTALAPSVPSHGIVRADRIGSGAKTLRSLREVSLTTEEGHKLRLALRLAGVTQARAARVLEARQTQLSAWMALGKGPDDVLQRLETAFGFQTDSLVDPCAGRGGNVLCHRYKARGSDTCAACAMPGPSSNVVATDGDGDGAAEQRTPSCVSCGKSEADQVRLRPARMLSGGTRMPIRSVSASAVFICTQCRNAHRHQLRRCPVCGGWMRAGRDRCHRCAMRS